MYYTIIYIGLYTLTTIMLFIYIYRMNYLTPNSYRPYITPRQKRIKHITNFVLLVSGYNN